jgi:thiosulfate reductase cytochrome b subunit
VSASGAAPARRRLLHLLWIVPAAAVAAVLVVVAAQAIRESDAGHAFLTAFPGTSALPDWTPVGFPAWLAWQHGLTAFLLLFIVRSGWSIRYAGRPDTFWVRRNDGRIRTAGQPVRIGLQVWFHLALDALLILNGAVFYVLLFVTGQWVRVIPVHWDAVPNAVSALLQYASLHWPADDGWTNYNALQLISYGVVIFVLAPAAILTGIRLTPGFTVRLRPLDRVFPIRVARRIHVAVMVLFLAFIVVHVFLVLATGALRNLNHMYAVRDDASWAGAIVFAATVAVMVAAWFVLRPAVLRALAGTTGTIRRR